MKIPMEWLSGKTILTADKVKKLDPGTEIWIHQCYGRRGEHMFVKAKIVQSGRKKLLEFHDWRGMQVLKEIRTAENIAYTAN